MIEPFCNLNTLDTSTSNDGSGEVITLAEVAAALFPTTNAQQTLTVDLVLARLADAHLCRDGFVRQQDR